jgi:SMI1-KNR4 cell-wall
MWVEFLQKLHAPCEFASPVAPERLGVAEERLRVVLPRDLKSLLLESDGVHGEYGPGLLWSLDRIQHDNFDFRSNPAFKDLYMPFDNLLFIADAGNGDQFAYGIKASGRIEAPDIYVWSHENDGRIWCAPDLRTFFEWWLTGKINA